VAEERRVISVSVDKEEIDGALVSCFEVVHKYVDHCKIPLIAGTEKQEISKNLRFNPRKVWSFPMVKTLRFT